MSIVSSEIQEGVLLEEEFISIPRGMFEELIRAETERDILEATIEGKNSYLADEVLSAIKDARKKHLRGVLHIDIGNFPPEEPAPDIGSDAAENVTAPDTADPSADQEVPDETETGE